MRIGCTKKLLDTLNITVCNQIEEHDLFCWGANLLTIKGRKAVVVVNDSYQFVFVLYGLKAKDSSQLKTLIGNGIRRCLENEDFKEEVIDQYFAQAKETVFTKTRGQVAVARLYRVCGYVEFMDDRMDTSELYQTDVSGTMNSDLFKPSNTIDYTHPYELLIQDF